MTELRFDDRVVVITGGARGLGWAYAELLAARGAKLVINDNGSAVRGDGGGAGPAEEAVAKIKAAGGEAVACTDSVATTEGGKAIIEAAMDSYGRIDVLIQNAGNVRYGSLDDLSAEDFKAVIDVHFMGAFNVVRPAFPIMAKAGYGRVVLTGSIGGIYGTHQVVNYGMSKAGMMGLNHVIAIEGADRGVKSNIILPGAVTRMADGLDISQYPPMGTDLVSPVVGWLAHESCSVSGEMYVSMGGRVARAFITETVGTYRPAWTVEDVAANLDAIRDDTRQWTFHPAQGGYMDHMARSFEMARGG